MSIRRLHVPVNEPEDVVRHLGKKEKDWKAGRSAHALCSMWFKSNALPQSVKSLLATNPRFAAAELVDAFVERQVDLGSSGRHSQTDLMAILGLESDIAVLAIEGKAGEPFGEYVEAWLKSGGGKPARLQQLCATFGISPDQALPVRYQLIHRAASAVYEAARYRSNAAIFLVQSFSNDEKSFSDYVNFLRIIGFENDIRPGTLLGPITCDGRALYSAWLNEPGSNTGGNVYLADLRKYVDELTSWCDQVRTWCVKQKQ
jgi:hypothetical protein